MPTTVEGIGGAVVMTMAVGRRVGFFVDLSTLPGVEAGAVGSSSRGVVGGVGDSTVVGGEEGTPLMPSSFPEDDCLLEEEEEEEENATPSPEPTAPSKRIEHSRQETTTCLRIKTGIRTYVRGSFFC
jgi:hypothetical protein